MEHPRRPPDLAGWFARHDEVIDFDVHQVADLDRVAAAVIDMADRGGSIPGISPASGLSMATGPLSWPPKTTPSFSACSGDAAASLTTTP